MKIILASGSPYRRKLLQGLGWNFEVVVSDYPEIADPKRTAEQESQYFAYNKARLVYERFKGEKNVLIIAADSIVSFAGENLGKPVNIQEAENYLKSYRSGQPQTLVTGMCLMGNINGDFFEKTVVDTAEIRFRTDISDDEIQAYLQSREWQGKCGGYSVFGLGRWLIDSYTGDVSTIIGLCMPRLGQEIQEITGESPLKFGVKN